MWAARYMLLFESPIRRHFITLYTWTMSIILNIPNKHVVSRDDIIIKICKYDGGTT
jgi:hypothetical protein